MIQGQRLADRIGVIMNGKLVQVGDVSEIFYQPKGRDIARFVGIDPIPGELSSRTREGHALITIGPHLHRSPHEPAGRETQSSLYIRPEEVTLTPVAEIPAKSSVRNQIPGRITKMVPFGPFIRVTVDCGVPSRPSSPAGPARNSGLLWE